MSHVGKSNIKEDARRNCKLLIGNSHLKKNDTEREESFSRMNKKKRRRQSKANSRLVVANSAVAPRSSS